MSKYLIILNIIIYLCSTQASPFVYAQQPLVLPAVGSQVLPSPHSNPALLKGLVLDSHDPMHFQFLLNTGEDKQVNPNDLNRLVKYFLTCLTLPQEDLWVNLSPYEKERIIPETLGQTALGRDLLAEDYILKQLTASLIDPRRDLGKKFWDRVYSQAKTKLGTTQIPVNTFNKVWILADTARLLTNANKSSVFILSSHLKVMTDTDYKAMRKQTKDHRQETRDQRLNKNHLNTTVETQYLASKHNNTTKINSRFQPLAESNLPLQPRAPQVNHVTTHQTNVSIFQEIILPATLKKSLDGKASRDDLKSSTNVSIFQEIILPALEIEINEGKNFSHLRQIFNAFILATWYKKNLKSSLINQYYANQHKMGGLSINDQIQPNNTTVETQHLASQHNNTSNTLNTSYTPNQIYTQYLKAYKKGVVNFIEDQGDQLMPRKYFSGGARLRADHFTHVNPAQLTVKDKKAIREASLAMSVKVDVERDLFMLRNSNGQSLSEFMDSNDFFNDELDLSLNLNDDIQTTLKEMVFFLLNSVEKILNQEQINKLRAYHEMTNEQLESYYLKRRSVIGPATTLTETIDILSGVKVITNIYPVYPLNKETWWVDSVIGHIVGEFINKDKKGFRDQIDNRFLLFVEILRRWNLDSAMSTNLPLERDRDYPGTLTVGFDNIQEHNLRSWIPIIQAGLRNVRIGEAKELESKSRVESTDKMLVVADYFSFSGDEDKDILFFLDILATFGKFNVNTILNNNAHHVIGVSLKENNSEEGLRQLAQQLEEWLKAIEVKIKPKGKGVKRFWTLDEVRDNVTTNGSTILVAEDEDNVFNSMREEILKFNPTIIIRRIRNGNVTEADLIGVGLVITDIGMQEYSGEVLIERTLEFINTDKIKPVPIVEFSNRNTKNGSAGGVFKRCKYPENLLPFIPKPAPQRQAMMSKRATNGGIQFVSDDLVIDEVSTASSKANSTDNLADSAVAKSLKSPLFKGLRPTITQVSTINGAQQYFDLN